MHTSHSTHPMRAVRCTVAGLAAVVLSLGVAACGDSDDGTSGSASEARTASTGDVFNDADVAFATQMIPHHAQAIQMVTLTDTRTLDPEVAQLAAEIRSAQAPEVETMVDWLTAWGEEVPDTSMDHSHGDDMGGMADSDMPGMMSGAEMQELEDAPDAEFQTRWLELMKAHHEGAIEMAEAEEQDGRFPDAVALATSIRTSQQAEIARIDALLD